MNVPAKVAEKPAARSAEEWRGIVEDFEREGTAAAAYCGGRRMTPVPIARAKREARRKFAQSNNILITTVRK